MLYCKDKEGVIVGEEFIYEVLVYVKYDNFLSLVESKYFRTTKYIKPIHIYKHSKYIEVWCELYSAPLKWLEDNGFKEYVKKIKNKKIVI